MPNKAKRTGLPTAFAFCIAAAFQCKIHNQLSARVGGVMFIRKISVYLQMILLLVFSSLVNSAESVP